MAKVSLMAELKLIANGKFYNRYMKEGAKLVDEQQKVPCIICAVEEKQITVEIIKDVDVHWIDEEGNAHTDHLINGEKMKFDKEFIEV